MVKKCWICGKDVKESTTTDESNRFYGVLRLATVNRPYATNWVWKGAVWVCQECMEGKIGMDHSGANLNPCKVVRS
ncbi:hypothetical protein ES703_31934 [subsurface metagenome]